MIEDKELRDLFRMESEEHLQCLDDGLLQLEQGVSDPTLLEDIFRAAHSVKGSARMLGLSEIQTQAHVLEDALGAIKKGENQAYKTVASELYKKLTVIRQLVAEAVGNSSAGLNLSASSVEQPVVTVPDVVVVAAPQTTVVSKKPDNAQEAELTNTAEILPPSQGTTSAAADSPSSFHIGTLRVDPERLDVLLTHAGELAVTSGHLAKRLLALDTMQDEFEDWLHNLKRLGLPTKDASCALKGLTQMQTMLAILRTGVHEDSHRLDIISEQLSAGIRTIRLLPFSTIFNLFPRLVHDLADTLHKDAELVIEGAEVVADKRILEEIKDPIMHLLRNAMTHGLEEPKQRSQSGKPVQGKVILRAKQYADHIDLDVQDDGRGLDLESIKRTALKLGLHTADQLAAMSAVQIQALILQSGFTTTTFITEISGRGVGLDVVRANVDKLKGSILIESTPGQGTTFKLQLPLTLTTMRVQIVGVQGRSYALPLEYIQFSHRIKASDLFTMEGRQVVSLNGRPIAVVDLGELLETHHAPTSDTEVLYCTFLRVENDLFGLIVDELQDETEVMLKAQSQLLKRVRNVSATTILANGEVCPVLNASDLLKSLRKQYANVRSIAKAEEATEPLRKKTLLLVEDSITTRTQVKRILESANYEVITAVDGMDGFNKFQSQPFDAVISDIEMPKMNGLALTEAIRKDKKHNDVPIILVTTLSTESDQRRGLEAGANAYLIKSAFEQQVLLDCLERLI